MADTKISALSSGSPGQIGDEVILARSGSDFKLTLAQMLKAEELDYVETTSSLTITATTDATAQAFVTGSSVSYNGSTRICVEAYSENCSGTVTCIANLYDGSTDLGRIWQINGSLNVGMLARRFLTPSNASHTYSIRFWKTSGTAAANAGAGGAGVTMPGYIRITLA